MTASRYDTPGLAGLPAPRLSFCFIMLLCFVHDICRMRRQTVQRRPASSQESAQSIALMVLAKDSTIAALNLEQNKPSVCLTCLFAASFRPSPPRIVTNAANTRLWRCRHQGMRCRLASVRRRQHRQLQHQHGHMHLATAHNPRAPPEVCADTAYRTCTPTAATRELHLPSSRSGACRASTQNA